MFTRPKEGGGRWEGARVREYVRGSGAKGGKDAGRGGRRKERGEGRVRARGRRRQGKGVRRRGGGGRESREWLVGERGERGKEEWGGDKGWTKEEGRSGMW